MQYKRKASLFTTIIFLMLFCAIGSNIATFVMRISPEVSEEQNGIRIPIADSHHFKLLENTTDSDGDGMPDEWESANDLDPNYDDSTLDPDLDEVENLDEYLLGTDPQNPDTDGDGFFDGFEIQKGKDPLDPKNHPIRVWVIILIVLASAMVILLLVWVVRVVKEADQEKIPINKKPSKNKKKEKK